MGCWYSQGPSSPQMPPAPWYGSAPQDNKHRLTASCGTGGKQPSWRPALGREVNGVQKWDSTGAWHPVGSQEMAALVSTLRGISICSARKAKTFLASLVCFAAAPPLATGAAWPCVISSLAVSPADETSQVRKSKGNCPRLYCCARPKI